MSIGAGVVVTITLQQIDSTPHAETGTQSDNQSLKNFDSRVKDLIEALVIAGRPVLIALPITVVFVWLMITASYLNPMEFLAVAPIVPILLFIAALFGFVALAYYLGGKKILKCDLVEALRTDYMG